MLRPYKTPHKTTEDRTLWNNRSPSCLQRLPFGYQQLLALQQQPATRRRQCNPPKPDNPRSWSLYQVPWSDRLRSVCSRAGKVQGKIPCTRCTWLVCRPPDPCYDSLSILRRAPFQSGWCRHRHQSPCRWCDFRGKNHRKAQVNRFRKGSPRCREWSRASFDCDWR
jgi:hypothetical protein